MKKAPLSVNSLEVGKLIVAIKASHDFVPVNRFRPWCLPDKIRRYGVGIAIDGVGQGKRASEGAVVVVPHPCTGGYHQGQRGRAEAKQHGSGRPLLTKEQPVPQDRRYREAKKKAFVGASGSKEYASQRHQNGVAQPR